MKRCYDLDLKDVQFLNDLRKKHRVMKNAAVAEGIRLLRIAYGDHAIGRIKADGVADPIFGPWMAQGPRPAA